MRPVSIKRPTSHGFILPDLLSLHGLLEDFGDLWSPGALRGGGG